MIDSAKEHHKQVNATFKNVEQRKKCGNNQAFDSVNARLTHRVRSQCRLTTA